MKALKIACLVAVLLVVAAGGMLVVAGIPGRFATALLQSRIERDTGYRVTIDGTVRVGLSPLLTVSARDLTVAELNPVATRVDLTIPLVTATLDPSSLFGGKPRITELAIDAPIARLPLLRRRSPAASSATAARSTSAPATIDRITVTDGTAIFSNRDDRVEDRMEKINLAVRIEDDRRIVVGGNAMIGPSPLRFDLEATPTGGIADGQAIPVELRVEMPDVLKQPLAATAEVKTTGALVRINSLSGMLGTSKFNGWASVDLASKPLVKLDVDFQRLELAGPVATTTGPGTPPEWSNQPLDLRGLNYVDTQARISAAQFVIGSLTLAPAEISLTLTNGVLASEFGNAGLYGGKASGAVGLDVSGPQPSLALRCDLTDVQALPLLTNLADFSHIEGRLQAKVIAQANGGTPRALVSNLAGTAFLDFRDGAIRGINVAQMIRSLTASTLSGWQDSGAQSTDLSQLSASFTIDRGQAATQDLALAGPLVRMTGTGSIDLPKRSLAFRVDPRLVMTLEGQGSRAEPVGLGVPVMIDGPWDQPRIYPDAAGMLDNPDAAYARLRDIGQGLFGPDGKSGVLGGSLGSLIQGLGAKPDGSNPAAPDRADPTRPGSPSPIDGILKQLFGR